jgi:hypothetical protein
MGEKQFEGQLMTPHKPEEQGQETQSIRENNQECELSQEAKTLRKHVEWVRVHYHEQLKGKDFLTEKDIILLALSDLYEPGLFNHQLGTTRIAESVSRHEFSFDVNGESMKICLAKEIEREGTSHDKFLEATTLHDLGKLMLPLEIMNNQVTDEEAQSILHKSGSTSANNYLRRFLPHFNFPEGDEFTEEAIAAVLDHAGLRATHILPVSDLLQFDWEHGRITQEQSDRALRNMQRFFGEADLYFRDFIEVHEELSRRLLRFFGYKDIDDLAGKHHEYWLQHFRESKRKPTLTFQEMLEEWQNKSKRHPRRRRQEPRPGYDGVEMAQALVHRGDYRQWKKWMRELLSRDEFPELFKENEDVVSLLLPAETEVMPQDHPIGASLIQLSSKFAEQREEEINGNDYVPAVSESFFHLTDVLGATVGGDRSYKNAWDKLDGLVHLVHMTRRERGVNDRVTALFLQAFLELRDAYHFLANEDQETQRDPRLVLIQDFIAQQMTAIQKNLSKGKKFHQ